MNEAVHVQPSDDEIRRMQRRSDQGVVWASSIIRLCTAGSFNAVKVLLDGPDLKDHHDDVIIGLSLLVTHAVGDNGGGDGVEWVNRKMIEAQTRLAEDEATS